MPEDLGKDSIFSEYPRIPLGHPRGDRGADWRADQLTRQNDTRDSRCSPVETDMLHQQSGIQTASAAYGGINYIEMFSTRMRR